MANMSLLKVSELSVFYGSSQALFDVNLSIDKGEVLALLGRNGMGKSTTIKAICRMLDHQHGMIHFRGKDLAKLPSFQAVRQGIGLVPEGRRCFTNLTVYENLLVAANQGSWDLSAIYRLFPRLAERKDQISSTLSGGEQQMLSIGRALMTNPKLLVLDEATEGLAPIVRQEILTAINTIKNETEMSILIVDKSLKELRLIADKGVILQKGRDVWSGKMSSLKSDVSSQYIGV